MTGTRSTSTSRARLGNTAANALRDQALAALQHQDNGLQISFTVPVIPSGLSSDTVAMLAGAAWSTIAVTPMIGVNDVIDEVFALANARQLVAFAVSKHLAWLSMWSATRDTRCSGGSRLAAQPMCSSIAQSPGAFATALGAYRAGGYGR